MNAPNFGLQGPAAELIGETVVFSCRVRKNIFPDEQPGIARTGIFTMDVASGELQWQFNMPTQWGGDVSYAGILPIGKEIIINSPLLIILSPTNSNSIPD